MRDRDLADSPLASCPPEDAGGDTVKDFLREVVIGFRGTLPTTIEHFRSLVWQLIERGLAEAESAGVLADGAGSASVAETQSVAVRLLQLISRDGDRHYALRALCYLRLLGHEGRSFAEIGAEFGLGRAAVHTIYRTIQRQHPELRSRGDMSEEAREACRRRRLGQRKGRSPWQHTRLWMNPTILSLP